MIERLFAWLWDLLYGAPLVRPERRRRRLWVWPWTDLYSFIDRYEVGGTGPAQARFEVFLWRNMGMPIRWTRKGRTVYPRPRIPWYARIRA